MSLFEAAAQAQAHLVEFNAGKCIREGNLIKPDLRKGKIYMEQGSDQLLHLYWKERTTQQSTPEDDLIIFPDEAEFTKVSQCTTGRVYLLRFKTSNEQHFYWLQNKKEDKDQEIVERVQELIRDPDEHMNDIDDASSHAELMRLLNNVESQDPNATPENILNFLNNLGSQNEEEGGNETTESTTEPAPVSTNEAPEPEAPQPEPISADDSSPHPLVPSDTLGYPTEEQLAEFRQMLNNANSGAGSSAPISLNDVLTTQSVTPLLNDPKICESLFPYLPDESEKSVDEVRQVIKSPQFSQALYSLSAALQTGQLGPLLSQLGLDYSAGNSVESFLNAVNKQAQDKKKNNNDAMDTD